MCRIRVEIEHPDLPEKATAIVDVDALLLPLRGLERCAHEAAAQASILVEDALKEKLSG